MKKILIVRNFANKPNPNNYNLQEVGLGKAIVRSGYNCDVIFYTDMEELEEVVYTFNGCNLVIKWCRAFKFMSNSIFFNQLKPSVLNSYEIIITFEYNQIMTFLLSFKKDVKVGLLHGPYKDNDNKIVQKIYDLFFTKFIVRNIDGVFTKSNLARNYLQSKGFKNIETIGVGLDTENLNTNNNDFELENFLSSLINKKVLLYVGRLEERRNINFLMLTFKKVLEKYEDVQLLIIGDGKKEDVKKYYHYAKGLGVLNNIKHIKSVSQNKLKFIYDISDIFVFPTRYDIFGMVLLESMYYGVPVISSINGGSTTLIDKRNGIIIDNFDEEKWSESIVDLLKNNNYKEFLGEKANMTIITNYTWDVIWGKMFQNLKMN